MHSSTKSFIAVQGGWLKQIGAGRQEPKEEEAAQYDWHKQEDEVAPMS